MESTYDPLDFLKINTSEDIGKAFDRAFKIAESIKPSSSFYPLGPITDKQRAILRCRPCSTKQIELDPEICGPKPININKYLNKNNKLQKVEKSEIKLKRKQRGGRRQKVKKIVNICKDLLKICTSEVEIEKYTKLLEMNRAKLNKIKKNKEIK